jgi:uncharacterized protein (DUF362 family)
MVKEMVEVIIAEGLTPTETLEKGLEKLKGFSDTLPENGTILILMDFLIPEGTPATINPESLGFLIKYLKNINNNRILVLPGTMCGVDQKKALQTTGLIDYILFKGAETVSYQQLYEVPSLSVENSKAKSKSESISESNDTTSANTNISKAPLINEIDSFIVLTQIRTDPILKLRTALSLLSFGKPPINRKTISKSSIVPDENKTSETQDIFWDNWIKRSFEAYNWKAPILVINDAFNILEGNSPFIGINTTLQRTNKMILSNNIFAADWATLELFGLNPIENEFVKKAIDEGLIKDDFSKTLNIIRMENLRNIKDTNDGKGTKNSRLVLFNPAESKLGNIKIRGLTVYQGVISQTDHYNLLLLLYQLQTLFYKDATNLETWAILVGKNPPEPKNEKYLLIYGDDAITTTEKSDFRTITKMKEVLDEEQLQKAIYRKQAKIRTKMDKQEIKTQIIIEDTIGQKEDPLDRELSTLFEKQALELKLSKFRNKIDKYRINFTAKNKKRAVQNKIPKVVLNRNILEINNIQCYGWDSFLSIVNFWRKDLIPTLNLFIESAKIYYDFPLYNKKIIKTQWKLLKSELNAGIKELYTPIMPKIKQELAEIIDEQKKLLSETKNEFEEELGKIKNEFTPKITDLKTKIKNSSPKKEKKKKPKKIPTDKENQETPKENTIPEKIIAEKDEIKENNGKKDQGV